MVSNEFIELQRQVDAVFRTISESGLNGSKLRSMYEVALTVLWPDHFEYMKEPNSPPIFPNGVNQEEFRNLAMHLWSIAIKGTLLLSTEFQTSYDREVAGIRFPVLAYLYRFIPQEEWQEDAVCNFSAALKDSREIDLNYVSPDWLEFGFEKNFQRTVGSMSIEKTILIGILQSLSVMLFRGVAGEIHIGGTTRPLIVPTEMIEAIRVIGQKFIKDSDNTGAESNLLQSYLRIMQKLQQDRSKDALVKYRKMSAQAMRQVPYFIEHYPEPRTKMAPPPKLEKREPHSRHRRHPRPDRRRY